MASLSQIAVYPVKGFPVMMRDMVDVTAGKILPLDRRFALTLDPAAAGTRGWKSKRYLLQIFNTEALSGYSCQLEDSADGGVRLTILDETGDAGEAFNLPEESDRFVERLSFDFDTKFGFVDGGSHYAFADQKRPLISLLNNASVQDMERRSGQPIDWRRLRGNLMVGGWDAWEEPAMVGKKLKIGKASFEVVELIGRCAAPGVNLQGRRDLDLLKFMMKAYKHTDCGLFLKALDSTTIKAGDKVSLLS